MQYAVLFNDSVLLTSFIIWEILQAGDIWGILQRAPYLPDTTPNKKSWRNRVGFWTIKTVITLIWKFFVVIKYSAFSYYSNIVKTLFLEHFDKILIFHLSAQNLILKNLKYFCFLQGEYPTSEQSYCVHITLKFNWSVAYWKLMLGPLVI